MRLWSLHPQLLDKAGLGAVWREGLLARAVLSNATKGYKNHPQLLRFKNAGVEPLDLIDSYLNAVCDEADRRGYHYNRTKLHPVALTRVLEVTAGQMAYEFAHLQRKLAVRAVPHPPLDPLPHPLFVVVPGGIEHWERF